MGGKPANGAKDRRNGTRQAPGAGVPALPPFLSIAPDGSLRIRVHAVPRASSTGAAGMQGASLKVRVQAPPEDGRANAAIVAWAAGALGAAKRDVSVAAGFSSREKILVARGVPDAAIAAAALWPDFNQQTDGLSPERK